MTKAQEIDKVLKAHGPKVEDHYTFGRCVYMIIEQYNPHPDLDFPEYAIKVNDLDSDLPDDGTWLTVNGNSRFETLAGANRALLQHLEENQ